jgi:hypothetical protein
MRRAIRRKNEWVYLTRIPISAGGGRGSAGIFRVSAAGTLVGLQTPSAGRTIEIKPYAIGGVTTDRQSIPIRENDGSGTFGGDVKVGITENLTVDLTYNTDFAQVEVDEQQVNLTRFSLFFLKSETFSSRAAASSSSLEAVSEPGAPAPTPKARRRSFIAGVSVWRMARSCRSTVVCG